jgi:phage gpG-like protein
MPTTYQLKSHAELQEVYDAIAEDIDTVDKHDWMVDRLVKMADLHRKFFSEQTGPDGVAWAKNAPYTIKRKGHSRILRGHPSNNFRLSRSLSERASATTGDAIREIAQTDSADYMSFGTHVEYSAIHDTDHRTSTGAFVPARRHVGLTDQHVNELVNSLADFIITELAK